MALSGIYQLSSAAYSDSSLASYDSSGSDDSSSSFYDSSGSVPGAFALHATSYDVYHPSSYRRPVAYESSLVPSGFPISSSDVPHAGHGIAHRSDTRITGDDEPIASRTRARSHAANLQSGQNISPSPESPSISGSESSDDSEDSDYVDTDSDSDSDSDVSTEDSSDDEDEPITSDEVRQLALPLSTWERIDVENIAPLDVVRAQFPETRERTPSVSSLDDLVCAHCAKPLHDDDWLDLKAYDFKDKLDSGDYCELCLRLKPDLRFLAEFCNCRCVCLELGDAVEDLCDSDSDEHVLLMIPRRRPVPKRAILDFESRYNQPS